MSKRGRSKWKKEVKIEQNYICPICGERGTDKSMNIHHIVNKCRRGGNDRSNVVALHIHCHKWLHDTYGNNTYDPRK